MPALNFPGNDGLDYPVVDQIYTNNGVSWKFSTANNSWTVITTADHGVDNGNATLGDTMVKLIRVGVQNLLTPAVNFKHDLTTGTLSIKGITTNTLFNLINSSGTTVNSFNKSGVLTGPSVIYRQASAPTGLTTDHTGVLWVDTDTSELSVYNGSTWDVIGTGVTLTTAQTISGSKTFSSNVLLSGSADIAGSGASKSIVLRPTDSGSAWVTALTLTPTTSTFASGNAVNFDTIHSNVSSVLVNMSTAQTIVGAKTFSGISTFNNQINFNGTSNLSTLYADSTTSGNDSTSTLLLRSNLATTSRYIQITRGNSSPADTDSTSGIILRPKNLNNYGRLYVDGNAHIEGSLTVSGTVSGTTSSRTVTKGCLRAPSTASGSGALVTTAPPNLSPITFGALAEVAHPSMNQSSVLMTNTSASSQAVYLVKNQMKSGGGADKQLTYSEQKIVMGAGAVVLIKPGLNGTYGLVTISGSIVTTLLGYSTQIFDVQTLAETGPITFTITLA